MQQPTWELFRDKLQEPLPKVELSSTFRATCLATILAVTGYVTLWNVSCNLSRHNVAKTLRDKLHETFHGVTAPLDTLVYLIRENF